MLTSTVIYTARKECTVLVMPWRNWPRQVWHTYMHSHLSSLRAGSVWFRAIISIIARIVYSALAGWSFCITCVIARLLFNWTWCMFRFIFKHAPEHLLQKSITGQPCDCLPLQLVSCKGNQSINYILHTYYINANIMPSRSVIEGPSNSKQESQKCVE